MLLYVWEHLGVGVPNDACFRDTIQNIRHKVLRRMLVPHPVHAAQQLMLVQVRQQFMQQMLMNYQHARVQRQQMELIEDQMTENILQIQEKQLAEMLFQQGSLNQFITKLADGSPDFLRKQLDGADPLARLLTVVAIGKRRIHLEKELIERLNDPIPAIRNSAHWSLLRVARGTDFGPSIGTSQRGMDRCVDKWQQWLSLQQSESPEMLAQEAALEAAGQQKAAPLDRVGRILAQEDRPAISARAARACDELVKANSSEQSLVLARLGAVNDLDNIEALALAIPQLTGALQEDAREKLVAQLALMQASVLRAKLQDDGMEMRCAAALACGRQLAKEYVPDLLQLLDDPEMDVVQTARVVLTELTGEDFGPSRNADRQGRDKALAAWRDWWKQQTISRK